MLNSKAAPRKPTAFAVPMVRAIEPGVIPPRCIRIDAERAALLASSTAVATPAHGNPLVNPNATETIAALPKRTRAMLRTLIAVDFRYLLNGLPLSRERR